MDTCLHWLVVLDILHLFFSAQTVLLPLQDFHITGEQTVISVCLKQGRETEIFALFNNMMDWNMGMPRMGISLFNMNACKNEVEQ